MKIFSSLILLLGSVFLACSPGLADEAAAGASRIKTGYAIAPVPLNLEGKNLVLVGLGSYIVNGQGGCNDCHTNPPHAEGGDPFLGEPEVVNVGGYLAGGVPFGPFVSANITPDEFGQPAGLTVDEFMNLMRTGLSPNTPNRLLQVMPWPVYGKMNDRDLSAVYEYLSAIPSLPADANRIP